MKYFTIIIIFMCLMSNDLLAQKKSAKFNVFMSYNRTFGLKEKNELWEYKGKQSDRYPNSFHIKGMYRLHEMVSCGVGWEADGIMGRNKSSYPIYSSVHFYPFSHFNGYMYSNLGYSLNTKITYPGLYYDAGIGHQWMFRKHFGLFLSAGYKVKQIRNIEMRYENKTKYSHTTRQSLSANFGFVF